MATTPLGMAQEKILAKVQKIISEQLGISDKDSINLDAHIFKSLGADSLDAVEIIMSVEDEFNVQIDDEIADGIATIDDLIKVIVGERPTSNHNPIMTDHFGL